MKKILKLVLGLLLVGSMVFAVPPATVDKTFTLTTTVAGVLSTKITASSTSTSASFQDASDLTEKVVATNGEGLPTNTVFYFNIRTNITTPITVAVKAANFTQDNLPESNASEIKYTLSATSGVGISDIATITSSSAPTTFTTFYKYTKPSTGLKIDSREITASLITAEFAEANQDSYKATITFNVTTTN